VYGISRFPTGYFTLRVGKVPCSRFAMTPQGTKNGGKTFAICHERKQREDKDRQLNKYTSPATEKEVKRLAAHHP
jgi:hypothetical protein